MDPKTGVKAWRPRLDCYVNTWGQCIKIGFGCFGLMRLGLFGTVSYGILPQCKKIPQCFKIEFGFSVL